MGNGLTYPPANEAKLKAKQRTKLSKQYSSDQLVSNNSMQRPIFIPQEEFHENGIEDEVGNIL